MIRASKKESQKHGQNDPDQAAQTCPDPRKFSRITASPGLVFTGKTLNTLAQLKTKTQGTPT